MEGLIQCGAFDFTGTYRSRLFASLSEIIASGGLHEDPNQLNMFELFPSEENQESMYGFEDVDEWEDDEKLRREKESLGFYITGHPLDKHEDVMRTFATATTQDLGSIQDKSVIKLAGLINSMRIKRTRRGEKMAVINLEDKNGFAEVIVFPDVFAQRATVLSDDRPLLVTGEVESGDNVAKVRAMDIVALETVRQRSINSIVIPVSREGLSRTSLMKLRDLIFKYPGECQLKFRIRLGKDNSATVVTHSRYSIIPSDTLLGEIESLTGVKVIREI
jgi:DNA polymerase-3 subunit alpha